VITITKEKKHFKDTTKIKTKKMQKLQSSNSVKPLLIYKAHLRVIKVKHMPSIMQIEVMHLWPLVTIKKQCMILELPSDFKIKIHSIMRIEVTA